MDESVPSSDSKLFLGASAPELYKTMKYLYHSKSKKTYRVVKTENIEKK